MYGTALNLSLSGYREEGQLRFSGWGPVPKRYIEKPSVRLLGGSMEEMILAGLLERGLKSREGQCGLCPSVRTKYRIAPGRHRGLVCGEGVFDGCTAQDEDPQNRGSMKGSQ